MLAASPSVPQLLALTECRSARTPLPPAPRALPRLVASAKMAAPVAGVRRRAAAVSGGACLYGSASSLLTARDDINAALPAALAPHAVFAECVMPSPAGGRVCVLVGVVYRQALSVTVAHISAAITLALSASPTIPLSSPTPPPAIMPLLLLGDWNARSAALGGVAEDGGAGRAQRVARGERRG